MRQHEMVVEDKRPVCHSHLDLRLRTLPPPLIFSRAHGVLSPSIIAQNPPKMHARPHASPRGAEATLAARQPRFRRPQSARRYPTRQMPVRVSGLPDPDNFQVQI